MKKIKFSLIIFICSALFLLQGKVMITAQELTPPQFPPPDDIRHYRGRRMTNEHHFDTQKIFFIEHAEIRKSSRGLFLVVIFNMPLDPLSIKPHNVFIDDSPLPINTRFRFNKAGNIFSIPLPANFKIEGIHFAEVQEIRVSDFNLRIIDAYSFNGIKITEREKNE